MDPNFPISQDTFPKYPIRLENALLVVSYCHMGGLHAPHQLFEPSVQGGYLSLQPMPIHARLIDTPHFGAPMHVALALGVYITWIESYIEGMPIIAKRYT